MRALSALFGATAALATLVSAAPADFNITCYKLDRQQYVTLGSVEGLVKDSFCPGVTTEILKGKWGAKFNFTRYYNMHTPEHVSLTWSRPVDDSATTAPAMTTAQLVDTCVAALNTQLLTNCATSSSSDTTNNNPMHWRAGGSLDIAGFRFVAEPLIRRRPAPANPEASCKRAVVRGGEKAGATFTFEGSGWPNSTMWDYGDSLKKAVFKKCPSLEDTWSFYYTFASDNKVDKADFKGSVTVLKDAGEDCLSDAIFDAGYPAHIICKDV